MEVIFADLVVRQQQVAFDCNSILVDLKEENEIVMGVNFDYEL
jgi:hypothetical protein